MSRSRRRTPIRGVAHCRSDRPFKRLWHRCYRSRTRQQVRQGREPLRIREYGLANIWGSNKEGRVWFGDWDRATERRTAFWISIGAYASLDAYRASRQRMKQRLLRK